MAFQVTPAHQAIFNAIKDDNGGNLLIEAVAGAGKTSTIVEALKLIPPEKKVLFLAFNVSIVDELKNRVPAHVDVMTLNGLGWRAYIKHAKSIGLSLKDIDQYKTKTIAREILSESDMRSVGNAACQLVAKAKSSGLLPDGCEWQVPSLMPDTFESWAWLADRFDIDCEDRLADTINAAQTIYRESCRHMEVCDFDDQQLLTFGLGLSMPKFDWVFVDEAQDLSPLQHRLVERIIKRGARLVAVGDPHQCHPAGTMIELTGGKRVPIENVKVGMELVSYHDCFRGITHQGRKVQVVEKFNHDGQILTVNAGDQSVRMTHNHRIPTRLRDDKQRHAVYLMESGKTSRIGSCQLMYESGFGPAMRMRHERADHVWVLKVFDDVDKARLYETEQALAFGLPENIFHEKGALKTRLMEMIGDNSDRARRCLTSHGRDYELPLAERKNGKHIGRYIYITEACNLIDDVNELRTFDGTRDGGAWESVRVSWSGSREPVYGITVEPTEGGHRLYVADRILVHNSIYGFRGADVDSMDKLARDFSCTKLPLHVSYRCAKAVVAEAQTVVGHIQPHTDAPEGTVVRDVVALENVQVQLGDFILCRLSAPTVQAAYQLIRSGIPAVVRGRDIGTGLMKLLNKLKATTLESAEKALSMWEEKEIKKCKLDDEAKQSSIHDRADTLRLFLGMSDSVDDCRARIERMFSNDNNEGVVICSTVHKAKGLEADRVFIINRHKMPHKMAKQPWQIQQEMNLIYVAITRAKSHLQYITLTGTIPKKQAKPGADEPWKEIGGNTYPVKDELKRLGCRWDAAKKVWLCPPEHAKKATALVGQRRY